MIIYLYKMTEDSRVVKKFLGPANLIAELSAEIKADTSIQDPEIITTYGENYLTANYMHIPAFGRYYYINNITVSEQRIIISAHVDVLKSFYDGVKDNKVIVKRSQTKDDYYLYLDDPYFMTSAKDVVEVKKFPNEDVFTGSSFLLTVSGPRNQL